MEKISNHFAVLIERRGSCSGDVYLDYMMGKRIKVFFEKFPQLDVDSHDYHFGKGAAAKALNEYAKIAPKDRLDPFDRSVFPLKK